MILRWLRRLFSSEPVDEPRPIAAKPVEVAAKRPEPRAVAATWEANPAPREVPRTSRFVAFKAPARTDGYIVQVGLDFGTAYMKAVCRDLVKDSAWVYEPPVVSATPPCLVPTTVAVRNGRLSRTAGQHLPSVKMALRACVLGDWGSPVLMPFRDALGTGDNGVLFRFVEVCAAYAIADMLSGVRGSVKKRLRGFGDREDDYLAVNMAIPVADAQLAPVNAAFLTVLRAGWRLSLSHVHGQDHDAEDLLRRVDAARTGSGDGDACFVYPEVSANVQGFVRSRVSRPDVYLFSDVGAGTVDQSVFIYHRDRAGADSLVYLDAAVLPLGSAEIELRASGRSERPGAAALEEFRRKKELGAADPVLDGVKKELATELALATKRTLQLAKKKLFRPDQLTKTRVIFGGGGHTENPYGRGTLSVFRSEIFANGFTPDTLGMPMPTDLDLAPAKAAWMPRLSVAYGLSFDRHQLVPFTYPMDLDTPTPLDTWAPPKKRGHAPTKDEV